MTQSFIQGMLLQLDSTAKQVEAHATAGGITITNAGGYWETGLGFIGVESLTFSGNRDNFSDYSLARIAYNVPEPSVIALFAAGLLGLGFSRRRMRS